MSQILRSGREGGGGEGGAAVGHGWGKGMFPGGVVSRTECCAGKDCRLG